MTLYDRQQGVFDGAAIAAAATARKYGTAISEWQAYADDLTNKLKSAESAAEQAHASRAAMAYLILQLANELEKYAPNHPLVNRQRRVEIVNDVEKKISSGSHTYEPKTGTIKPVIR